MATKTEPRTNLFQMLAASRPAAIRSIDMSAANWAKDARMDWEIKASDTAFTTDGKTVRVFPGKQTFYRSDTEDPLAIVGKKFHPVQPKEILEFYAEVSKRYGFKLAIAGELNLGRKLWAMAETPHELEAAKGDAVKGGLFFITACDGSMSTKAFFTSIRIRCLNQLPVLAKLAKQGSHKAMQVFSCTHGAKFSVARIERDLERMEVGWDSFQHAVDALTHKKITEPQALSFFARHFYKEGDMTALTIPEVEEMRDNVTIKRVLNTYRTGVGQEGIIGTAWGAVNAVTRYLDHETRSKDEGTLIRKAWVEGARLKSAVFVDALQTFAPKAA